MCVLFARTARGPNPLVTRLAAEVVALRLPATHHLNLHRFFQGATWLWAGIFLTLTTSLAVLMVTEPAGLFLMLSTVLTAALVVAGAGASTLWFLSALRKLGLTVATQRREISGCSWQAVAASAEDATMEDGFISGSRMPNGLPRLRGPAGLVAAH